MMGPYMVDLQILYFISLITLEWQDIGNNLHITGPYDNLVTFTSHLHEAEAYLNSRNEVENQSLEQDLKQKSEEHALTTSPGSETDR